MKSLRETRQTVSAASPGDAGFSATPLILHQFGGDSWHRQRSLAFQNAALLGHIPVPVENYIGRVWRPVADWYALPVRGDERMVGGVFRGGDDGAAITGGMAVRDALATVCPPRRLIPRREITPRVVRSDDGDRRPGRSRRRVRRLVAQPGAAGARPFRAPDACATPCSTRRRRSRRGAARRHSQ
jgi:hypothetical protein